MFNLFITNQTPYLGKLFLKFEKFPYYSGSRGGKLNKIHLNLGFTKLVSRIHPLSDENGWKVDPIKKELIEKHTGGLIKTHKWWIVKDEEGNTTKEVKRKPKDESKIVNSFELRNSFVTKKGAYINDVETAWWYYKNNMYVCEDYPSGAAEKIETDPVLGKVIVGYYGYTHRGGSLFKIGDRLFDAKYVPVEKDYEPKEWKEYVEKFTQSFDKQDKVGKKWMLEDGFGYVVPFNRRGHKDIETLKEAKQAAINVSKYLS